MMAQPTVVIVVDDKEATRNEAMDAPGALPICASHSHRILLNAISKAVA